MQRKLRIGYSLAAALVDRLEEEEVISAQDGSKSREVFFSPEDIRSDEVQENETESSFITLTKEELEADEDELYEEAKAAVIENGKASVSFLQRKLRIGYSRSARLMDLLEERGVIAPQSGKTKTRKVLID